MGGVSGGVSGWGEWVGCIDLSALVCSGSFLTSPLIGTLSLALVAPLSITYDIVFEHVRNAHKYTAHTNSIPLNLYCAKWECELLCADQQLRPL